MSLQIKNSFSQYGLVARVLHWSSVILLVSIVYYSGLFEDLKAGDERQGLVHLHSSLGLVFLCLMVSRLIWRFINFNPIHSYNIKTGQKFAAVFLHRTVYFVVILQCMIGLAILLAAGGSIYFFDVEMSALFEKHEFLHRFSIEVHSLISYLIYSMLALHIFVAIYHQIFGVLDE